MLVLPPRDMWPGLETHLEGALLVSAGQRPGMLLNIRNAAGHEIIQPQMSEASRLRNPGRKHEDGSLSESRAFHSGPVTPCLELLAVAAARHSIISGSSPRLEPRDLMFLFS